MSDQRPSPNPPSREEVWDRFIDELDRAGQAGSAAEVLTPTTLHPEAPSGKRFADLTRDDVVALSRIGGNLGRRGDVVKEIWEQTQKKLKGEAKAKAKRDKPS